MKDIHLTEPSVSTLILQIASLECAEGWVSIIMPDGLYPAGRVNIISSPVGIDPLAKNPRTKTTPSPVFKKLVFGNGLPKLTQELTKVALVQAVSP